MNKSLLPKIIIAAVVLIAFIGYTQYSEWKNQQFTLDRRTFNVQASYDQVMDMENKQFPAIQMAERYDLTIDLDYTIKLPNMRRTVEFHKALVMPFGLYVMYSVNVRKRDKSLEQVPYIKFEEISFQMKNGEIMQGTARLRAGGQGSYNHIWANGHTYNKQVYRSFVVRADLQKIPRGFNWDEFSKNVKGVKLHKVKIMQGEEEHNYGTIPLDVKGNALVFFDQRLNKQVTLESNMKITFKRLKVGIYHNQLYLDIEPFRENITEMVLLPEGANSEDQAILDFWGSPIMQDPNGEWFLPAHQFFRFGDVGMQEEISFDIAGIGYVSNKKLAFTVTDQDFSKAADNDPGEEEQEKWVKFGKAFGASFYYEIDNRYGSWQIPIKWETDKSKDSKQLNIRHFTTAKEIQNRMEHITNEMAKKNMIRNSSPVIKIENEDGEMDKRMSSDMTPPRSDEKYRTITYRLSESFVDKSDTMKVTIARLPYIEKVERKTVQIELPTIKEKNK